MKKILLATMLMISAMSYGQVFKNRAQVTGVDTCINGVDYVGTAYLTIDKFTIAPAGSESIVSMTLYNTNRARLSGLATGNLTFSFPSLGWIRADNETAIIGKLAAYFNKDVSAITLTQYP